MGRENDEEVADMTINGETNAVMFNEKKGCWKQCKAQKNKELTRMVQLNSINSLY